ncbi:MAG: hypothetical protein U9N72_05315 [Bacteroidota bacterium]|nr:hypothetical protein [Bacteroidota bacterium]
MKIRVIIIIPLALSLIISLISCEKPDVIEDPDLLNSLYTNSSDTINIETGKYILETDLSRNLMPGGPIPTKRPLVALIFLVNTDSLQISSDIDIRKLYVIKDRLIWTSNPNDSNDPYLPDFKLGKVSNDGPEWNTDIYVDVVAEVIDRSTDDRYLVIAKHQYIEALY